MDSFVTNITRKFKLVGFISALFIIYPNIVCLPWELHMMKLGKLHPVIFPMFFIFKFSLFWILFSLLIRYNLHKILSFSFKKRFCRNFFITAGAYIILLTISKIVQKYGIYDFWNSILIFQFLVTCFICSLIGHISKLYTIQQEKEIEIEHLKTENLQSQLEALSNQINPHFFFNSLSGISSLIRKKDNEKAIKYVDELSDIFRYILQCNSKGLVTLREELQFIEAFRYVMEVRFANKLTFAIDINDEVKDKVFLPVLSLLPLVDNIIVHNIIDSDHKMNIDIYLNENDELVVSNPIFPKLTAPTTHSIGLKNLENRFMLLTNRKIRIENNGNNFIVYLPLK